MSTIIYGDRIGKTADLVIACDDAISDCAKDEILLTQREDCANRVNQ